MRYEAQLQKMIELYEQGVRTRWSCRECRHRNNFGICPKKERGFMPEISSTNEDDYCPQFEEKEIT